MHATSCLIFFSLMQQPSLCHCIYLSLLLSVSVFLRLFYVYVYLFRSCLFKSFPILLTKGVGITGRFFLSLKLIKAFSFAYPYANGFCPTLFFLSYYVNYNDRFPKLCFVCLSLNMRPFQADSLRWTETCFARTQTPQSNLAH